MKKGSEKWFGQDLLFTKAPRPSDIIWENQSTSTRKQCVNHLWTILVAALCLTLTFLMVVMLRNLAPYTTESAEMMCDNIDEYFWDDQ